MNYFLQTIGSISVWKLVNPNFGLKATIIILAVKEWMIFQFFPAI